ncbi:23S rRNA (adenine(2030)-N(6))-methyltransferase RlmJ [Denitratisoma oestradiolicum]|uniref:Ribosomal RNA large subunit methyltransferase J n=1 Tax=Denitratisoma oestradiolicum TaxID=311182 RepID=A0A6S6XS82_9PROT|nr:23S rRNA (adenine(2030)-N(6))-methyltransferase RlmJ [Denitratisoma oestradiolicum]TWO81942.1 23S rRNA (adenine(2030)-N(6))-methyltransferase RlmJ [Denitratisoma oestradiolicum]CAB1368841.1 Ribosomal RNA large subunit methyltransferase J [Denitratisoma oestradiolicum]
MLSYRHAFHAGNHADVLKHFVLVQLLRHFNQKDKPYWVVDTHAGAGLYDLQSVYASKNAEFSGGIGRLWERKNLPAPLADYVDQVRHFNPDGRLRNYPGSPALALSLMREADRLRLFELHSTDARVLADTLGRAFPGREKHYALRQADGFAELKSVLPPPPRRGFTLMDPAYEDKRDYLRALAAVKEGLARFATGTFALWYPQVQRGDSRQLPEKLKKLPASWLHVSLTVQAPSEDGFGMHGSGLFILNPPWTLASTLKDCLPLLTEALAQDDQARHQLELQETAPAPTRPKKNSA